jgi:hypothetical protein
MKTRTAILAGMAALTWLALGVGARADLMTPFGLNPGDEFRFVFVTDGVRDATSSNITDYDNFVQAQAGGATYNGVVVNWLAIVSTLTVNAIDHVGVTNAPVYLADGTEVTPNTGNTGLWSEQLLHAINEDQTTQLIPNDFVWTGSLTYGISDPEFSMGNPSQLTMSGFTEPSDSRWVRFDDLPYTQNHRLYAISQVLTVPETSTAVPEPSTLVVVALGAVAFLGYGWSGHRRARRRLTDA